MSFVGNYNHLPTHPVLAKQLKWGFRMQNLLISASKIVAKYFSAIIATHLSIIVANYYYCCQIFVHLLLIPGQRALWWSDKLL